MTREPSDKEFLAWMEEGWIAGYPPWFYHFLVQPSDCKTEEETSRLLHLLRSIEDGKPDETRRLLEGMNPNLRLAVDDRQTESLFEWAAEKAAHNDCVRALLAAGASILAPNLVWKLVSYRKQELLEEVLRAGADPNSGPTEEGPLITACWGNARAARLLLDAGARMDVTTTVHVTNKRGIKGVTPLMVAAYAGEERIVKLLLERGVNAWAVDADGNTALHWARISRAKAKAARIIPLLEQAGALPIEDSGGLPEPVDFSRRARTSHFREALQAAKFLTGSPARSVEVMDEPVSGAKAFRIRDPESALNLLEETRAKAAPLGALAFLSDDLYEMSVPYLVLVPTTDYREAVIAFGTPIGQETDCYELAAWLEELEKTQPFVLTHLAPDRVRARFTTPIRDPRGLVKAIQTICPDAMDANLESYAKHLQESRQLFLWWD